MPAPPFRTAVAAAVELSDRDSARKQSPSHVAIEPTMGAESVHRDQDQTCRACWAEVLDMKHDASRREIFFVGGTAYDVHRHRIP